ncbi:MAG TPA: uroporphyrinogen-III synthase [Ktedonobacteraceae bacterium]|nr:uroporphyrinogen-III synthase [Ktedonobacteraceae bacterium]
MPESRLQTQPLEGKRVLVTRTREQAASLSVSLKEAGAIPLELPVIRIVPPSDWQPLDQALRMLIEARTYDWLIFTSVNGVKMVLERLQALNLASSGLHGVRIATIGPATASALEQYGLSATLVPDEYIAESVARALRKEDLQGQRILLARAAEARQVLITELEQAGAIVDVVTAYRTLPVDQNDERANEVLTLLRQHKLDILTFTSSSTVHHFMNWLEQSASDIADLLRHPVKQESSPLIACIGPITASTARSYGLEVNIEAQKFTIAGLVGALIDYEVTSK